jgi:hypothetical protein
MANASMSMGLQLRSTVKKDGILELSLVSVAAPEPKPEEVIVRIDASPINPSDQGLLLAGADMSTAKASGPQPRRDGQHFTGGDEGDGGTPGSVPAHRQRRGRGGRPGGCVSGRASVDGQDRRHPWWRHVRAVPMHQGRAMPGLAARDHAGRGRLLFRQSAHRARHGRDHALGGSQGARAHGGRYQP